MAEFRKYPKHPTTNSTDNNTHGAKKTMATMMTNEQKIERIREVLREAATETPGGTQLIARHIDPAHQISAPFGMPEAEIVLRAQEAATAAGQVTMLSQTFKCRPGDGALAFSDVMLELFGTVGSPKPIMTFFGPKPPEQIEVIVGVDEKGFDITRHAQWGRVAFAPLDGEFYLGEYDDPDLGPLFHITASVKLAMKEPLSGFFNMLTRSVGSRSIYRGKSIFGLGAKPKFLSLKPDPGIVYTRAVEAALDQALWRPIRFPDALKLANIPANPQVLLYGPYGTGKSEAARKTAEIANGKGWTFVQFDSGRATRQDFSNALKTARLMAPCVLFVEDIDTYLQTPDSADSATRQELVQMLNDLDGLTSKNTDVIVLMTTNKLDSIPQSAQRPGRMAAQIEISYLDQEAIVRLLHNVCGTHLGKINEERIYELFKDYPPAFIRQAVDGARQASILRQADELDAKGIYSPEAANENIKLSTVDFEAASAINANQWESFRRAGENKVKEDSIGVAFKRIISTEVRTAVREVMSNQLTFNNEQIGDIDVEAVEVL